MTVHGVAWVTRTSEPNEFGELEERQTKAQCKCSETFTGDRALKRVREHARDGHPVEDIEISWLRDGSIRVDIMFMHGSERCTAECWEEPNGEQHITIPELDSDSEMDEIVMQRRASRILSVL